MSTILHVDGGDREPALCASANLLGGAGIPKVECVGDPTGASAGQAAGGRGRVRKIDAPFYHGCPYQRICG